MSPIEVACVGLATADTIVPLPSWPEPDGRLETDAIVRTGGGPAATAAVALARLGRRAAIVGAVGDDETGAEIRDAMAAEGVDVRLLISVPGRTAESVILVDRGAHTRSILHVPGVEREDLDAGEVSGARWVHADHAGHELVAGLVDPGRISVDAGAPIDALDLRGVGVYAPSADALSGRYPGKSPPLAVAAALVDGAQRVVVTLGDDGAIAADASGAWRIPTLEVEVVSTLGAGDVFHGALLAMLLEGHELAEAAKRAGVAAALSCAAIDGRSAIPDRDELEGAVRRAPPVEPVVLR
jgi:sulfofructose kinase